MPLTIAMAQPISAHIKDWDTSRLLLRISALSECIAECAGERRDESHYLEEWDAINVELGRRGL